jgi:hypothetical protein
MLEPVSTSPANSVSERHAHPLDVLGEEIAALAGQIDAATHTLLTRIRAFDQRAGWARQGALSCAHWLSWRIGLAPGAAREKVRVARALGTLPRLDEALRQAQISYSKVRALTRIATPDNEERLLHVARGCTAAQLEALCRQYRGVVAGQQGLRPATEQWVHERWTDAGMVRLEAQLAPDEAALVMKAIEAARERLGTRAGQPPLTVASAGEARAASGAPDVPAETPPKPSAAAPRPSRADALVALAESSLAGAPGRPRQGGERYTLLVHLRPDASGLLGGAGATLEDGTPIPAETLRRIACDAGLVPVAEGAKGEMLGVGRRRRTITPTLRRALTSRDGACRFPGCTNRRFVDAHHVKHWIHGGRTALDNLILLCGAHHRVVHEDGFKIELDADGTTRVTTPEGQPLPPVPAPPPVPPAPLLPSRALPIPDWWGDRIDHGLAVSEMLGPARALDAAPGA